MAYGKQSALVLRPFKYAYDRAVEPIIYGYPLGRVRVLEGRLLPLGRLERLVEADNFAEQRRILAETSYGELFEDVATAEDVEDALDVALERAYDFMEEARLPEPVIEFFRIRYDFLNVRMLLKYRIAGAAKPARWSAHGSVPAEAFEAAAAAGEEDWADELPARVAEVAAQVIELAVAGSEAESAQASGSQQGEESGDAVEATAIDMALDRALYARIGRITASEGSAWFERLGRVMVDMANTRIAQRAKRFGKNAEWIGAALIECGSVSPEQMATSNEPVREMAVELRSALIGMSFDELSTLLEQLADAGKMDIAADNVVLQLARRGRLVAIGVEPIASYMLALESEIALLRIVLLGKLANLPAARIHERVRELYV